MNNPILLREYNALEYTSDTIKESIDKNGGKIILKGIFQMADKLNQNGRIYPRSVLEREVRNYQKLINENRALGECVPEGTKIYTENGWKNIAEVKEKEKIFTLNLETDYIELHPINYTIDKEYNGFLYHFQNGHSIDMMLTENHLILAWDRYNKSYTLTAKELYDGLERNDSKINHSYLRRAGDWNGESPKFFNLDGIEIESELWAAFLGIYLAEGHSDGVERGHKQSNNVCIHQKIPSNIPIIRNLIKQLPFEHSEYINQEDKHVFVIRNEKLHSHLFSLGDSHSKYIPLYTKNWSKKLLSILLDWMLLGDGKYSKNRYNQINEYSTASVKLANDVFELMFKLGAGSAINSYQPKDRKIGERIILSKNSKEIYIVQEHTSRGLYLDSRFLKKEKIPFNGHVYCVNVKNGTWLMNYNDSIVWTHNCNHPETSVIDLKNASHIVRKMWMEDDVVYGELEVLHKLPSGKIIQGLLEHGIKIGISSRGVGSTREENGHQIVNDDFQLVGMDIVSEPSVSSAFLSEGKELNLNFQKNLTKSDRIDRALNEIIFGK